MKNLHMTLQEMPTAAVAFDRAFAAAGVFRSFSTSKNTPQKMKG